RGGARRRREALDRPRTALARRDRAAADEPERTVVEVVRVEVVEAVRQRARPHVALELLAGEPPGRAAAARLIGVVATDDARPGSCTTPAGSPTARGTGGARARAPRR